MNRAEANKIITAATEEKDKEKIWEAYKQVWEAGVEIAMDAPTFESLFCNEELSRDAVKFASKFKKARKLLAKAALQVSPEDLTNKDRQRVFIAVVDSTDFINHWRDTRNSLDISDRRNFSGNIIRMVTKREGRARARQILFELWDEFSLEEEKEYALKELDEAGGLTSTLLRDLGPEVIELVKEMWRRRVIKRLPFDIQPAPVRLSSSANADREAIERISCLLQPLQLRADLRDAGLHPHELYQMSLLPGSLGATWKNYKEFLMRMKEYTGSKRLYHMLEEMDEFGFPFMLTVGSVLQTAATSRAAIQFPLLRVLHVRELLESPELSATHSRPERYALPQLFLHILGAEPAVYFPELRIANTSEKRWRARFAETMAEALATLFMESALDIDLTLLERIRKIPGEKRSADFRVATKQGELITFQATGSSDRKKYKKHQKNALKEMSESIEQTGPLQDDFNHNGRSFVCSFYGALQGSSKSTQLHVNNTPFKLSHLFPGDWEQQARRRHYAAALQFADQFELAEQLLMTEIAPKSLKGKASKTEAQKFLLKTGDENQEELSFLGAYDDIEAMARKMRFRQPSLFHNWRLFRGIYEREFENLVGNKIPSREIEKGRHGYIPHTGIIPGRPNGRGRGVYSLLANGSFLAIEIGQDE